MSDFAMSKKVEKWKNIKLKILGLNIIIHWYIIAEWILPKGYALVHDDVILSSISFWFSIVVRMLLQESVWQCWLWCEQDFVVSLNMFSKKC